MWVQWEFKGCGVLIGTLCPVLVAFLCSAKFNLKLFISLKTRDSLVFQHSATAGAVVPAGVGGGERLHDFVGQVVTERHGNGQGLHLLRGHYSAEGHPAQVLQTGDATRTLPEVHATIASPLEAKHTMTQQYTNERGQRNISNQSLSRRGTNSMLGSNTENWFPCLLY